MAAVLVYSEGGVARMALGVVASVAVAGLSYSQDRTFSRTPRAKSLFLGVTAYGAVPSG